VRQSGMRILSTLLLAGGLFIASDASAAECPRKIVLTVTGKTSAGGTPMAGDGPINWYWFFPEWFNFVNESQPCQIDTVHMKGKVPADCGSIIGDYKYVQLKATGTIDDSNSTSMLATSITCVIVR
jgi:hypothetical protein